MAQAVAHHHQRKSEEVPPRPFVRASCPCVVGREPDAPHGVHRAGLDEHLLARGEQEVSQGRVLGKLGLVCASMVVPVAVGPSFLGIAPRHASTYHQVMPVIGSFDVQAVDVAHAHRR